MLTDSTYSSTPASLYCGPNRRRLTTILILLTMAISVTAEANMDFSINTLDVNRCFCRTPSRSLMEMNNSLHLPTKTLHLTCDPKVKECARSIKLAASEWKSADVPQSIRSRKNALAINLPTIKIFMFRKGLEMTAFDPMMFLSCECQSDARAGSTKTTQVLHEG